MFYQLIFLKLVDSVSEICCIQLMSRPFVLNSILNLVMILNLLICLLIGLVLIFNDTTFTPIYNINHSLPGLLVYVFIPITVLFSVLPRFLLRLLLEKIFKVKLQVVKLGILGK